MRTTSEVLRDAASCLASRFEDPDGVIHMATAVYCACNFGDRPDMKIEFEEAMSFLGMLDLQPRNAFAYDDQAEKFVALSLAAEMAEGMGA